MRARLRRIFRSLTASDAYDPLTGAFAVDLPCPECGNRSVIGFLYLDQHGQHQHTHYVCTFWKSPDDKSVYLRPGYDASKDRCGWHGWVVPEWDA